MTSNFIDPHRPIALIGAGQLGELALDLWPPVVDKPMFFLDEFSHQKTIRGIPVVKTSSHIPDTNIQYALAAFKLDAEYIKYLFTEFLSFNVGGLPDVVIDNITGIKVAPFDTKTFGHVIDKFILGDVKISTQNLRKFAKQTFSFESIYKQYDYVLDQALKRYHKVM